MNRHARRALEAKGRTNLTQKLGSAEKALAGLSALPVALGEIKGVLAAIDDMRNIVTESVREVANLEHRLARQEYVMTRLVADAYQTLGMAVNEPYPRVDWEARRAAYEAEFDQQGEAAPEAAVTET